MPHTIFEMLQESIKKIDRFDAEILLAHVMQQPREFVIAHPEYTIGKLKIWKMRRLVKKRTQGIPYAYLTGRKGFYGVEFLVNKHTLTPRPETEILVEAVLGEIHTTNSKNKKIILCDIGTGSGCIPISILKSTNRPIETYASDISKKALRVAKKNAQTHATNITFFYGNLLEPIFKNYKLPTIGSELIITANLPYLTQAQFDAEFTIQHEPKSALIADDSGLALYKELLTELSQLISDHHSPITCFFEIDPSQTEKLSEYIHSIFRTAKIDAIQDGMGNDRILKIRLHNSEYLG